MEKKRKPTTLFFKKCLKSKRTIQSLRGVFWETTTWNQHKNQGHPLFTCLRKPLSKPQANHLETPVTLRNELKTKGKPVLKQTI